MAQQNDDPFNIDADLPTMEDILANLPLWQNFVKKITLKVEEATNIKKREEDSKRDYLRWQFHSKDPKTTTSCDYEECCYYKKESSIDWYEYKPRKDEETHKDYVPVRKLCTSCYIHMSTILPRIRMYETETVKEKIERSKNEEEWVTINYEGNSDRKTIGDVLCCLEDTCCYSVLGKVERYYSSKVLRGTTHMFDPIAICDWCQMEIAIDDKEITKAIRRKYGK